MDGLRSASRIASYDKQINNAWHIYAQKDRKKMLTLSALVKPKKGKFSAKIIDGTLIITTREEASENKANKEIKKEIAHLFRRAGYESVEVDIHGEKSRRKTLTITWEKEGKKVEDVLG
jgi:uncharacterized protein YggU (UPF0235/DUF167 family)